MKKNVVGAGPFSYNMLAAVSSALTGVEHIKGENRSHPKNWAKAKPPKPQKLNKRKNKRK